MSIQERLREAYGRTPPGEPGAYDRFLRRRARSVRTVAAAVVVLVLVLAGLAPRLLAGQDRGVVQAPKPVPAARTLIARLTEDGTGRPQGPSSVAFHPDGNRLAVGHDHRITLWDVDRRSVIAHLDGVQGVDQVAAVAFAPDGRTLAASVYDQVFLWDLASRTRLASLPMGTANIAGRLAFSRDGTMLAAGDGHGKLILWDVARRSRLAIVSTGIGRINDLAFRPDGRVAAVGGDGPNGNGGDGVVPIDITRRRPLFPQRAAANSGSRIAVAFRPDGKGLAAVGRGGQELAPVGGIKKGLTIWSIPDPGRLGTLANDQQVEGVVLSRDGGLLAVSSPPGGVGVVLWDVDRHARLGPLLDFRPSEPLDLSPSSGTFTNDGGKLAIADGTGSVFVWSTANP